MGMTELLSGHVTNLASQIGPRNLESYEALEAAASYVELSFRAGGLPVTRHGYEARGRNVDNIEAVIPGTSRKEEIVVLGAHYDTVAHSPGANDNGSGVAALLVLAQLAAREHFERTVRFVAFVNEENPYFHSELMGSYRYARMCRAQQDRIVAMVSLETIGYYSSRPGSQKYAFPLNLIYPSTADFIAFVSNWRHRSLTKKLATAFRAHSQFPSQHLAAPEFIPGIGSSDHWSFWQFQYPAAMITDTTNLRYPHFHAPSDTAEQLDYPRYSEVVEGLRGMLRDVANG